MKYKFVILMALVALLSTGLVAATYDLQVSSVVVNPASPVNGQAANVTVEVQNNGPDNIVSESITLLVDFDDSTTATYTISNLNAGNDISFSSMHTWTTSTSYTINASISGMNNDSNPNTDEKIQTISVVNPTIIISTPDKTIDPMYRGDIDMYTVSVSNSGNTVATITNTFITSLNQVGGTGTISNSNIAVSNPGTIAAGSSANINLGITILSSVEPATYKGNLSVVYTNATGGSSMEVSEVTVVVDNHAPTVNAISNQIIVIGNTFSYNVVANDVEGDTLTYALSGAPTGMTVDVNTGAISWTPTVATTASVSVIVDDSYDTTTETFTIESKPDAPGLTASADYVLLGSSNDDRGTQVSSSYTITNTGTQTITGLTAQALNTAGSAISTTYGTIVAISTTTLNPGDQATVSVTATIPSNQDSKKVTIGKIRVEGSATSGTTYKDTTLQMEAKSYLRITDVELEVNNDDKEDMSDGENYDSLKEGDVVELTIKLENLYTSSDDIKIENAYVVISDDNNWDIDEESSDVDIKDSDDEKVTVKFTVPYDLDDDTTTVTIEAYGEDENGNFDHYDEYTIDLEIDRPKNEISISSWSFDKNTASCTDSYATLSVRIRNTGTDDQEEAAILVQSDDKEIDWYKRVTDIELDESDSTTLTFNIPVKGVEEGAYFVEITTYYDNTKKTDSEVIALEVTCGDDTTTTTTTPSVPGGTIVITPPTTTTPSTDDTSSTNNPVYGEPVSASGSFRNSNSYLVVLVIVVIVLILVIAGLAVSMFTKR